MQPAQRTIQQTILCFGDSNTWGAIPGGGRYDIHTRWPGVMRDTLGAAYWIIEEGLGGRTTVFEDQLEPHRRGLTYFPPCLMTHSPVDTVIILLGTNDMKARFAATAIDIANGAKLLVNCARQYGVTEQGTAPRVILVCPPAFADFEHVIPMATDIPEQFAGGYMKSRRLNVGYRKAAGEAGCDFFDAGTVVESSPRDAIHWEADQHTKLGNALAALVANTSTTD